MASSLSFVIIVKNEAASLDRCLASVKPYVNELIVVDTGSTDDTIAIAQQYGAKISHFTWCDDFAAARNYACSLASGDWILTLDADEELIVHHTEWLCSLNQDENLIAYSLERQEVEGDASCFQTLRLFRRLNNIKYIGRYHESLYLEGQLLGLNSSGVSTCNDCMIIHYGNTEEQLLAKSPSRTSLLESIRKQDGLSLPLLWTLAGFYKNEGKTHKYQNCCQEALDRLLPHLFSGDLPIDQRIFRSWLYSLGFDQLVCENFEMAHLICQKSLQWFPDYPPIVYLNGLLLKMLGFSRGTIPYYEMCLEAGQTGHYFQGEPFHPDLITRDPAFELGLAHLALNQIPSAIAAFELALSFDPNHIEAQNKLQEAKGRFP